MGAIAHVYSRPIAYFSNQYYHRIRGGPQMRELVVGFRASDAEPPYMRLEPKDLEIVVFTDAALATFHLEGNNRVSRRTFVLACSVGFGA